LPEVRQRPPVATAWLALNLFTRTVGPRGELPLRFGRQRTAQPARVGERIRIGDLHHRLIVATVNIAARPFRMTPIGALHIPPPADRSTHGRRVAALRRLKNRRPVFSLRFSDIAGSRYKIGKLCIGDLGAIDPEWLDLNAAGWPFFR